MKESVIMKKKNINEKTELENTEMRTAYYELSDKVGQMREASAKLDDSEIRNSVKKLEQALGEIHAVLDKDYIWD
jgi:hypothetical protein